MRYELLRDKARHEADLTNRLATQADEIAVLRQDNARICEENAKLRLALDAAKRIASEKIRIPMLDAGTEIIATSHASANTTPQPKTNVVVSTFMQTDLSIAPDIAGHSDECEKFVALREAFERDAQSDRKHAEMLMKEKPAIEAAAPLSRYRAPPRSERAACT